MSTVVVLGGSFGGLTTAYELQQHLIDAGARSRHSVVLVSDQPWFLFRPALPWVVFRQRQPQDIMFDLGRACTKRGITFINDHAVRVDADRRYVELSRGRLFYDYLVFAVGQAPRPEVIPGLLANALNPLWLDDSVRLQEAVRRYRGGPAVFGTASSVPWPCPVYELMWFFMDRLERRRIADSRLSLVTPEPGFMHDAGPGAARRLEEEARQRGVTVHVNSRIAEVTDQEVRLEDGSRLPSVLSIILPSMAPSPVIGRTQGLTLDHDGFLETDAEMRVARPSGEDSVWAVGDCVSFDGPKSGRSADLQGKVAAWNVGRRLKVVRGAPRRYISEMLCFVRVGPGRAVFTWRRPSPHQGRPKRVNAGTIGRWPYFAKIAFEKTWLARHH